jgi:glycosyltransferase involved in cell wall biosynthesis
MIKPLISIIIPAYNYARFLGPCLDAIRAQTYENWEVVVVNNGSTDNTAEVLDRYDDPRIRKFKIDVNDGPVKAWAMGYELSRGDYVALLPADDMFTPNKLARQVAYLNAHPEVHCVATYIDVIDDSGQPAPGDHWMEGWINREVDYNDLKQWRWKHHFCIPSALYLKSLCDRAGKIPLDGLTNICDWDFHVRLLGAGARFAVIPEPLTLYRWHQSNTSHQRSTAHNQWIYSYIRSLLPALRRLASDPRRELKECIEGLYLDPNPNYFLEEVPTLWRCAHLEALLNPEGNLQQFSDYRAFKVYTEQWQVDSENRAAIAALDQCLMGLRERLLRSDIPEPDALLFPLERTVVKLKRMHDNGVVKASTLAVRVGRELGRGYRKLRRRLGIPVPSRNRAA